MKHNLKEFSETENRNEKESFIRLKEKESEYNR